MRIDRPNLDAALLAFARAGHGLVVGRPGVGKSYALRGLARELERQNIPIVFLPVEELGSATEEDMRRGLGYSGTFDDQLVAVFAGSASGVMIFDGFDAARNEQARDRLLQHIRGAIRRAPPNWSVVVSVRNYDASRSQTLLSVFAAGVKPGTRSPGTRSSGLIARSFEIPALTEAEALSGVRQIAGLEKTYGRASDGFRRLILVPFNLWLVERVMRGAPEPNEVSSLESETQLLALFWEKTVTASPDGVGRTVVLQRLARIMVASRRLSVEKAQVYEPASDSAWQGLLSAEVLSDAANGPGRAAFTHNILFDYAVSVLVIDPDPMRLSEFLTEDRSRPLFLRPSLLYYLTRLWYSDRLLFWKSFWALLDETDIAVRLVGRLIPPYIAATEAKTVTDLEGIVIRHRSSSSPASQALLRLFQALRFADVRNRSAWLEIGELLSSKPDRSFIWEMMAFASRILDDKSVTVSEKETIGRTVRTVVDWAWDQLSTDTSGWFEAFLGNLVLPMVFKTYGTAPESNRRIAKKVLALVDLQDFSIRLLSAVSDGIQEIYRYDAVLAADVYRTVFGHVETSEEKTSMGGIILNMTSTRRQDFSMCQYVLAKAYSGFLQTAPADALSVGIEILNLLSIREHVTPYLSEERTLENLTETFSFAGRERSIVQDLSATWEQVAREEENDIGDAIVSHLSGPELSLQPSKAVEIVADVAVAAVGWRKLLEVGQKAPSVFAHELHELALARPIQLGSDTLVALGSFVERAAPVWDRKERLAFEESVLALAEPVLEGSKKALRETFQRRTRDRLLACVPRSLVETQRAREIIDELAANDALPTNEPLVRSSVSWGRYGETEWLEEQGVDLSTDENVGIRAATTPISAFADAWRNEDPGGSEIEAIIPQMDRIKALLESESATPIGADPRVVEQAWTHLAGAARAVARTHPARSSKHYEIARTILLAAARRPLDKQATTEDAKYTWAGWSPSPRTEAIEGLAFLIWKEADGEASEALASFATSSSPSERFLAISHGMNALFQAARKLYWRIVTERVANERNEVVLTALLQALGFETSDDLVRVEAVIQELEPRLVISKQRDLRRALANWLVFFSVRRNKAWAWGRLRSYLEDFRTHAELIEDVNFIAINLVTPSRVSESKEAEVIARAIAWTREVVARMKEHAATLYKVAVERPNSEELDMVKSVHTLVDWIVARLYFNLRRRDDPESDDDASEEHAADGSRDGSTHLREGVLLLNYYTAIRPLLVDLLDFSDEGVGGVRVPRTAHHFMQLLNALLPVDPQGVLDLASRLVKTASAGGYHLDSMAVREAVTMVEQTLADYRSLIAEGKSLQSILGLLDVFADVGWPDASRLVWRLDEVFR